MPTLLKLNGFRFFFYSNEHEPKHVHVIYGNDFAKINLETVEVVDNYMKAKDLKKVVAIVEDYKEEFLEKWDEYFS